MECTESITGRELNQNNPRHYVTIFNEKYEYHVTLNVDKRDNVVLMSELFHRSRDGNTTHPPTQTYRSTVNCNSLSNCRNLYRRLNLNVALLYFYICTILTMYAVICSYYQSQVKTELHLLQTHYNNHAYPSDPQKRKYCPCVLFFFFLNQHHTM
jgi:hypothetical protein